MTIPQVSKQCKNMNYSVKRLQMHRNPLYSIASISSSIFSPWWREAACSIITFKPLLTIRDLLPELSERARPWLSNDSAKCKHNAWFASILAVSTWMFLRLYCKAEPDIWLRRAEITVCLLNLSSVLLLNLKSQL